MLYRIFIAINLPDHAKDELLACQKKWPELPARWIAPDNLHLTLAFLGNTSDQELQEVCNAVKQIGERHEPFSIEFNKIVYGPSKTAPRMIWVVGEISPELSVLQKDIVLSLSRSEDQPFSPHLTLARLKTFELQRMELEELPDVDEEISVSFQIISIEVMESTLKRSGAEYTIVQSIPLTQRA